LAGDFSATLAAEHLDQNSPTFKLMPTLVLSIGILVLLSVGSVLIVNWIADRRIVQEIHLPPYHARACRRGKIAAGTS
jgi:hypothetical protein